MKNLFLLFYIILWFTNNIEPQNTRPLLRLSRDALPSHYTVRIYMPRTYCKDSHFLGKVQIHFIIKKMLKNNKLILNIRNIEILKTGLHENGIRVSSINDEYNIIGEILYYKAPVLLKPNISYKLSIYYKGYYNDDKRIGIYKHYYNKNECIIATHLEPLYARSLFPCFDEPTFKATFSLIVLHPRTVRSFFNTEVIEQYEMNRYIKKKYAPTPKMSTYLFALVLGNYECSHQKGIKNISICYPVKQKNTELVALSQSSTILKSFENFTNSSYSNLGIYKIEHIAVPTFPYGAMENWGLVIYHEYHLLWNSNYSTPEDNELIIQTMAHEIAHQWFGNLVTLDWWNNLFLNEAFCQFLSYYIPDKIYENWTIEHKFITEHIQNVMEVEAAEGQDPIVTSVNTLLEAIDKFNIITYQKGGAIIRMLLYFMGEKNFKRAVKEYINRNKYGNVNPRDLWKIFNRHVRFLPNGKYLDKVMHEWIYTQGYPIVSAELTNDNIKLTQLNGITFGLKSKWIIPITFTTSFDIQQFFNTSTKIWLDQLSIYLDVKIEPDDDDAWIMINNQQIGYYRVDYDEELSNRILNALITDINQIHPINRAQFIDDLLVFGKLNRKKYINILPNLLFLKSELNYYVWLSAFRNFKEMLHFTSLPSVNYELKQFFQELIYKFYNNVCPNRKMSFNQSYALERGLAYKMACAFDIESCVDDSKKAFYYYRYQNIPPISFIRETIYCTALKYSKNPTDWSFIWDKYKSTEDTGEKMRLLYALGCTTDRQLMHKFIDYIIKYENYFPDRYMNLALEFVYYENHLGLEVFLEYLLKNTREIHSRTKDPNYTSNLFPSLCRRITTNGEYNLAYLLHRKLYPNQLRKFPLDIIERNLIKAKNISEELFHYFRLREERFRKKQMSYVITFMFLFTIIFFLVSYINLK